MPPDLAHTMQRACGNCHSNWTNWPWYSHVAPVSWLVAKDVARGRQSLNFSEWTVQDSKTAALAASRLLATCANLSGGTMPPASYQFMHPESRLPQAEIDAYCKWSRAEADSLLGKKLNGYKEKAPSQ